MERQILKTKVYHITENEESGTLEEAAQIIREGGLLGIPTETVYGLGANALDGKAVLKIFEAKGRPQDNPLLIHIPDASWLEKYCEDIPPLAYKLAETFWPGPLTMILKSRPCISDETRCGLNTVGVRCPANEITAQIIRLADVPIAAPSANRSGHPSCTNAETVLEDFDGRIDGVVDGGPCQVGVESTILDMTSVPPKLLRPGGLSLEEIRRVIPKIEADVSIYRGLQEGEKPKAPGMKYRHYAPEAPVTAVLGGGLEGVEYIKTHIRAGEGVICYEEYLDVFEEYECRSLGKESASQEHAQRVFEVLRSFDKTNVTHIWAQCPGEEGLDLAVSNRIKKAAGFHVVSAGSSIQKVADGEETVWINPYLLPFRLIDAMCQLAVSDKDLEDARSRLERFAPFIQKRFPETRETGGLIESPLKEIEPMQRRLEAVCGCRIPGRLFLKMDSHLAIAGSVKARGGIYEVLKHAEALALKERKIRAGDSYSRLADDDMKEFFGQYMVQVGSTGNLGLSIGIMSAALGFQVRVHMSADARQWKKELLRNKGVEVIEYADDYSRAVAEGRKDSDRNPRSYFVDDEKSVNLFVGYGAAAGRLREQLDAQKISVDEAHPLIVYIPAGVGGAPGGICYGLKRMFKDHVHCFFTEPVMCPSVLLGIATQKFERVNVHDFGLSGITEADGLACASPSGFVTRIMTNLVSGEFTVEDRKLYEYLRLLYSSEGIQIEPSACAAFAGPVGLLQYEESKAYLRGKGLNEDVLRNATQIVWATGGSLVPEEIKREYLEMYL